MADNFVFIDNIYRSRQSLLDILEERDYDVAAYRKFSPAEATAAAAAFTGLSFKVSKKSDPTKVCEVRYANISRQRLDTFFDDIDDDVSENTEVIVMMSGAVTDAHHLIALKQYMKLKNETEERAEKVRRKLRVSFFSIYMLVINPTKHVLVPKHEIVPEAEHKEIDGVHVHYFKVKIPRNQVSCGSYCSLHWSCARRHC
jgi:hypothetical protein